MLKLYSTASEDPPTKSEIIRKPSTASNSSNLGGKLKSSFEGKEYSRLSTSEKESGRVEPETLFSSQSSAEDSDIPETSPSVIKDQANPTAFRWNGTKLIEEQMTETGNVSENQIFETEAKKSPQENMP